MTFKDALCDVYNACTVFYRRPSNEDILKAANIKLTIKNIFENNRT